ncbi:MAG: DUF6702 family protein [Aridibacter sp.]
MFRKFSKYLVVVILMLAVNSFAASKHEYHTTFTTIDYNTEENLLEISIQVFAHDLLPNLERKYKKGIDLENTKDVDQILENYLAEKFVFKTKSNQIKKFKWIGKELETEVVRFYVEIPFDEELEGAEMQNTLFFESFREQVNLVHFKYQDKKADLVFKVGDSFKKITHNIKS